MLRKMVEKIKKSGANVVFCQKGIDDLVQHFLAKEKIYAARRVKKSDMEKLAKATGANVDHQARRARRRRPGQGRHWSRSRRSRTRR